MRLSTLCFAAGAAGVTGALLYAAPVQAQSASVQIYGIVDAGLVYADKVRSGGVGSPTNSLTRIQSGNLTSSRIGFKGREDLGGGMSAVFALENGFSIDTGTASQNGRLFGRSAYVGLAGALGEFQVGRETTAVNDFGIAFDPVGPALFSTPTFDTAYIGRADNAVKYISRKDGLDVVGQYSTGYDSTIANGGEVPGASKVGREMGLNVNYAFGKLQVGAVIDRQNGTSVATQDDKIERKGVAAAYSFSEFKLFGAFQWQTVRTGGVVADNKFYWIGGQYSVTPALTLEGAVYVYDPEGSRNTSTMPTLLGIYSLSKRTDLYSQIAFMKSQQNAAIGMAGAINPGDNQTGLTLGIRHRF